MSSLSEQDNSNSVKNDCILRVDNVQYKGHKGIGVLLVCSQHVAWQSVDSKTNCIFNYSDVRAQRVSPAAKPKVQLQLCPHNGDAHTFIFVQSAGHDEQLKQREAAKDVIQEKLTLKQHQELVNGHKPASAPPKKPHHVSEKEKLLHNDKKLAKLYADLVSTGTVAAKDFWADFAHNKLEKHDNLTASTSHHQHHQNIGVSPGFLNDIQQSDGCNNITLNLTTEIRQQIFHTYPTVKALHLELVPHERTEKEFWTAFFESHYFHRDRTQNQSIRDIFSKCLKLDDAALRQLINESSASHSAFNLSNIRDDFDYTRSDEDSLTITRGSNVNKSAIMHQFNYHCARVLQASTSSSGHKSIHSAVVGSNHASDKESHSAEPPRKRIRRDSHTDPLSLEADPSTSAPTNHKSVPLNVGAHQSNVSVNGTAHKHTKHDLDRLQSALNAACNMEKAGVNFNESGSVLRRFSTQLVDSSQTEDIDPETKQVLIGLYTTLEELLRHFWSCFPVKSPEAKKKVERMMETIHKFEENRFNAVLGRLDYKYRVHMDQMITAANSKYDAWLQSKK